MLLFTLPARLVLGWRLMNRRSEVLVASSSAAPVSHQKAISRSCEIVQQFACVGIVNDGSNGHRKFDRFALPPASIAALSVPAALGSVLRVKAEVKQGVVVYAGHHRDIAAASAVPAARPPARHVLFAPKGQTAIATIPGFYADFDFIDEHGGGR